MLAPALSGDGNWLLVASAGQLTDTPTAGTIQLYARDLRSGRTVLVSASARGVPASAGIDAAAERPHYAGSVDGRYAVFTSTSTNLSPDDDNGHARDVFRKDLVTGAVVVVDAEADGSTPPEGVLGQPTISGDGNRVAFATGAAAGLVGGDLSSASDVVVRDIRSRTTQLASVGLDGRQLSGAASGPQLSADGRVVAFTVDGAATGAVPGDVDGAAEIAVRDLLARETRAIAPGEGTRAAVPVLGGISADGRSIAIQTTAVYAPGDLNGVEDVYLARPFEAVAPRLLSGAQGRSGNGASRGGSMTADGTRVAFSTAATDLVPGDLNGTAVDLLVAGSALLRESGRTDGAQAVGGVGAAVLSASGSALAFGYDDSAGSFLPGDADGDLDVIVRERAGHDLSGPRVDLRPVPEGVGASARRRLIVGGAEDPSGVVELSIAGRPVILDRERRFSVALVRQGDVPLVATDGAGNRTRLVVTASGRATPAYAAPVGEGGRGPTARNLRVTLRSRAVVASFSLESGAPVRVLVDLRGPAGSWIRLGTRARRLAAGRQRIVVPLTRSRRGVIRVRVLVAGTGVRQSTRLATIPSKQR